MSEESSDIMISAFQLCDIQLDEIIEKKHFRKETLICSFENKDGGTDFAFSSGPILLICDGMCADLTVRKRFELEFEIKKIFFHTFTVSRNAEKLAAEEGSQKNLKPKSRDYLVICGEHRLQFISLPDYHFYHYEIPFKLRNVFPCSTSILVERFYDSSTEQKFHHHDTFHLYSLSGPFGELLPLIYKTNGIHPQWKFCWQSHQDDAEMVDAAKNFVVVFDQKEKVHRIYMARETEEQEVHAAVRFVETLRKNHDSTIFTSSLAPNSAARTHFDMTTRSPAMPHTEGTSTEIDGRSPLTMRSGFGHSTPNNPNVAGFQGTLPTPIFEGNNDSHIWASTPNTPRVNTRGGLERNIHTRTLARMVNDEAAPPSSSISPPDQSRLQTTASPFHRTHLTQLVRRGDSNADLLRDFTRMIRDTPRNFSRKYDHPSKKPGNNPDDIDFGDLERDPDVDLLLSKVCLECVYIEPKNAGIPKSEKIFISNFLSEMYLNLVSTGGKTMKIIPVWRNAETTRKKLAEITNFEPISMDCLDAAYVEKSGLSIVLSPDFTISMIGGNQKISPIFIKALSNQKESADFRLFAFSPHSIIAIQEQRYIILRIPKAVTCQSSNDLMRSCFTHLNREFSQNLLRKWRSIKRDLDWNQMDLEQKELSNVVIFMLENVGIRVNRVNRDEEERAGSPEMHGGKQMRPRMSEMDVMSTMREFFEGMSFYSDPQEKMDEEEQRFKKCLTVELDALGINAEHARDLLNALHTQSEEWSVYHMMHPILIELAPYVYILARILNFQDYEEYYLNLFKNYFSQIGIEFKINAENHRKFLEQSERSTKIPCWSIHKLISNLVYEQTTQLDNLPKSVSKKLLKILTIIATGRNLLTTELDLQMWIGQDWKKRLGLAGETLQMFKNLMKKSRLNSMGKANEMMRVFEIDEREIDYLILAVKVILLKFQTDAFAGSRTIEPKKCVYSTPMEMATIANLRWKHDIRRRNIQMMLDSSRPILIATNILRKNEDDNMKELQDRFLTQTSYRTFSQPFGRAYFDFRTSVPSLLTSIYIPRLCVGGMVYPARVTCDPPNTEPFKNCTEWGNFYNAMASALRMGSSETVRIDNEWIVMVSKNIKSTAVIGGLTLGFGLNGHLAPFNMYHAHQMLSTFDKFNSVALLLGLSASNFATCDNQIHKILATYLSFLMGPTPLEIKLDFTIQTAAISGLGLLFADSGNMNIAKKLVNEIGKMPNRDEEPVNDRSAYKLSAGFSLGLIMLGKGNGAASAVVPFKQNIPSLSTRLIYMMKGMKRDKCVFLPQTSSSPVVNEVTNLPFSNGGLISSSQVANHIKETDNINIHQSAEPAAIALGLMFMKTHNEFIANALALPNTMTDLERLKPDSMYSRVLAYCLVMWNTIKPTHDFVKSLVPKVIREYARSALHFGVPIRRDEDGEEIHEPIDEAEERYWSEIVDTGTVAQTFLYTVSAACMAIALKFSSCGGPPQEKSMADKAFKIIEFYTKIVLPDGKSNKNMGSVRMCLYAGAYTRASCLSMTVLAMSILRAGTGNLEVLRYARLLRLCDKPEGDWISVGKKHFEQMIAHQALGILIMGEGRYAFKKDNLSIALTIIATYPTIPLNVADNSHYHQPLRYLWALAVEPRLLVPYDVAESAVVEVDVTVVMKEKDANGEPITYKQKAPSLLPPLEDLQRISVGGGRFELVHINLQTEEELKVMKDVMSVGLGRIMLKRYNVDSTEMKISEATALYDVPLNLMDILQRDDTAYEIDETEIAEMMKKIEEEISLNSSDIYPSVQMQLNSVKDMSERTSADLAELEKKSLHLLGESIDLWPDEVNVSNAIHGLADRIQNLTI